MEMMHERVRAAIFGDDHAEGNAEMKNRSGGKGAGLTEMMASGTCDGTNR